MNNDGYARPMVAMNEEIAALRARVQLLEDFLCTAAPMAWATGGFMEDAYEWEKQAAKILPTRREKKKGRL